MVNGVVGVGHPVLPFLPAEARSVGPSAGLLEGAEGGVVFVFGMATYSYVAGDEAGRRLAAVQLADLKIATAAEVASAFGVNGVTLWTWRRDYTAVGVAGLLRARSGPKGPIKLTGEMRARIVELDGTGLTLAKIAAQAGVSTATVRVALGRVGSAVEPAAERVDDSEGAAAAAPTLRSEEPYYLKRGRGRRETAGVQWAQPLQRCAGDRWRRTRGAPRGNHRAATRVPGAPE